DDDGQYYEQRHHAPRLKPPTPTLNHAVSSYAAALTTLVAAAEPHLRHLVFLLDSLDRVPGLAVFEEIVVQDLRAIQEAGIGTVVVGPLSVLFGAHRPTAERFEHVYRVPTVDVASDNGLPFLTRVLNARAPRDILSDECTAAVAQWSGGV